MIRTARRSSQIACRVGVMVTCAALTLAGCQAIPLEQLEKASQAATGASSECSAAQSLVDLDPNYQAPSSLPAPGSARKPLTTFHFLVPAGRKLGVVRALPAPGAAPPEQNVHSFSDFKQQLQTRLNNSDLSADLKKHPVTNVIFNYLVKSFAQAQLDRAKAAGYDVTSQQTEVSRVSTSSINLSDLKGFTQKVQDGQFHPHVGASPKNALPPPGAAPTTSATQTHNTFARYFVDYYEGNFYDRLGTNVTKPTISAQTPDSDIASALTIVIEYLIDLIDPTPVLVDQDVSSTTHQFSSATHFYPQKTAGASQSTDSTPKASQPVADQTKTDQTKTGQATAAQTKAGQAKTGQAKTGQTTAATAPAPAVTAPANADSAADSASTANAAGLLVREPEALKTGLANYKVIPESGCGVTTANVMVLYDAANAAGDSVSAVSGLVSQSWGGWGFSFLGFLKFSIGDNQTLGVIVKTAASRVASRAALAAAYWALDGVGEPSRPLPPPGSPLPAPGAPPPPVDSATLLSFGN
jgi:hypothetical protein